MENEHDDEYGAKGTNNGSARGQVEQHREVHAEGGDQCSDGPSNGQPPADPVSKKHGSNGGNNQVAKYQQHAGNRHRRSYDEAKRCVEQEIPETDAQALGFGAFQVGRDQQELPAEDVMEDSDRAVNNGGVGPIVDGCGP